MAEAATKSSPTRTATQSQQAQRRAGASLAPRNAPMTVVQQKGEASAADMAQAPAPMEVVSRKPAPVVQPKVTIGPANDHYEQEADRIADQVVSMAPPKQSFSGSMPPPSDGADSNVAQTKPIAASVTPLVQKVEAPQEEVQQAPEEGEKEVQTKVIQMAPERQNPQPELDQERDMVSVQTKPDDSGIAGGKSIQLQPLWVQQKDDFSDTSEINHTENYSLPNGNKGSPGGDVQMKAQAHATPVIPINAFAANAVLQRQAEDFEVGNATTQQESSVSATSTSSSVAQMKCAACEATESTSSQGQPDLNPKMETSSGEGGCTQCGGESAVQMSSLGRGPPHLSVMRSSSADGGTASSSFESTLNSSKGGGEPMSDNVKSDMEGRFGADFSAVRIHTGADAVQMNREAGSQAFAHGSDVYFGSGKYQPETSSGKHLLAHELTHTIQQGGSGVKRSVAKDISSVQPRVQRGWVADKINQLLEYVPGWTLFTVIVGYNPVTSRDVPRTPQNFLKGILGFTPAGTALYNVLNSNGAVDEVFNWLENERASIGLTLSGLRRGFDAAWDEVGITNSWSTNVSIVKRHVGGFLNKVKSFGSKLITKAVEITRNKLGIPLVNWVKNETRAYPLLTTILGQDPVLGTPVERSPQNIVRGFLMLTEEGEAYWNKLNESGKLDKAIAWLNGAIKQYNITPGAVIGAFQRLWNGLSWRDLFNPIALFRKIYAAFRKPVTDIMTFMWEVAKKVLALAKEWFMGLVKAKAHTVPGYPLLTVILEKDPITQEVVPRTAKNFIKGFMSLAPGGLEKYKNLEESGAIDKAFAWLGAEVKKLNLSWAKIKELFSQAWALITIDNLLKPIELIGKLIDLFKEPVSRILAFVGAVALKVLEFIFTGVLGERGARVLAVLKKGRSTFLTIIKDPIGFLGNLLKALKQGFKQFSGNILTHLKTGLFGWLFGALEGAGLQLPEKFDFKGIMSLTMQVLGLTWPQLRPKFVKHLGERVVAAAETAGDWIMLLKEKGFAGVWERIMEKISDWIGGLKDAVIGGIRDWVITRIVTSAITKLATMFNPVGAVINSIITMYNTLMFFLERFDQILTLVETIVNSIAKIASGDIKDAADWVEKAMARTIPVIISFLARLIGLGGISSTIQGIIKKVQDWVGEKVDKLIGWIVGKIKAMIASGKAAWAKGKEKIAGLFQWWKKKKNFTLRNGEQHKLLFKKAGAEYKLEVNSSPIFVEDLVANRRALAAKKENEGGVKLSEAQDSALGTALTAVVTIRQLTKNADHGAEGDKAKQNAVEKELDTAMNGLTKNLIDGDAFQGVKSDKELPLTKIVFTPKGNKAGGAEAFPLTKRAGNTTGSPASPSAINEWGSNISNVSPQEQARRKRLREQGIDAPAATQWNQVHLISHKLHGPGNDFKNVAPGTNTVNRPLEPFETAAFNQIKAGAILKYWAKVEYRDDHPFFPASIQVWRQEYEYDSVTDTLKKKEGASELTSGPHTDVPPPGEPPLSPSERFNRLLSKMKGIIADKGSQTPWRDITHNKMNLRNELRAIYGNDAEAYSAQRKEVRREFDNEILRLNQEEVSTDQKSETLLSFKSEKEQQADRVADQVTSGQVNTTTITPVSAASVQSRRIQRLRETSNPQPELDASRSASEVQAKFQSIQRSEDGGGAASSSFESNLSSSKGGGQPMDDQTRGEMESGIGADFSGVRIHNDSKAHQMSSSIGAQAFTHGNDIYFNQGKYDTNSSSGKHLLAHELTHTVQQGASVQRKPITNFSNAPPSIQRALSEEEKKQMEQDLKTSDEEQVTAIDPAPAESAKKAAEKANPDTVEVKVAEQKTEEQKVDKKLKGEKQAPSPDKGKEKPEKKAGEKPEMGPVGAFLDDSSAHVLDAAIEKTGELGRNEKEHQDAKEKQKDTDDAQVVPASENQQLSNFEQVDKMDKTPAPQPDEGKARSEMQSAISAAMPKNVKTLNEFKSKGKGKVVGNKVMKMVNKDLDDTKSTYNEIEKVPAPKQPEKAPVPLPALEKAKGTAPMDLGKDAVPPLKPEHTNFDKYSNESDELVKKEGISEENLAMVDSGDLAKVNKERGGLKKRVKEEPGFIQSFAAKAKSKVQEKAKADEKRNRQAMEKKRQAELTKVQGKQGKTKTELEKKRDKVAKDIKKIYDTAQKNVKKKLKVLELQNKVAFKVGQMKFSKQFEYEVNRDINKWKRKRYSGFWGAAKWIKDQWVGITGFPEVENAFKNGRERYVKRIDKLIDVISKQNKKVIEECKKELADARVAIKKYVDGLGPELKDIGNKSMKEMQSKLDEMDKFIDKKNEELNKNLEKARKAAIKAIDKKIEKMKESMSGLLSKLGNLIAGALMKFFKWALEKMGLDVNALMDIINRGKKIIGAIIGDPIGFIVNLFNSVKKGVGQFVTNIKKHLISGLINWLTGQMGDVDIQLPAKWDLKGILSIVLQVLGLTWQRIRAKLVKRIGEKKVKMLETGVEVVKLLITGGPMALWKWIQEKASEIKKQVMEGIRNWIITNLVKLAVEKLLSMLAGPWGAILQAIKTIYNLIMFFVENLNKIMAMVTAVFDAIGPIAMGDIATAANGVEKAMAMTIPIILNFLAKLIGLSGIGKAVQNVITKIRKPVDTVVDKALDWIVKKGKALWGKVKSTAKGLTSKGKKKAKEGVKSESELTPKDRKRNKQYVGEIKQALSKPLAKKPKTFADMYAAKKKLGAELEKKYQKKVRKGLKVTIKYQDLKKDEKDGDMDLVLSIKPNDVEERITVTSEAEDLQGVTLVPLFRGIHFSDTREEVYQSLLASDVTGKHVPTAAALEKAKLATFSDALLNQPAVERGIDMIRTELLKKKRQTSDVKAWWRSQHDFPSQYHVLLNRFINKYGSLEEELKLPKDGLSAKQKPALGDLTFTTLPFVSTSMRARHSLIYCLGGKFSVADLPPGYTRRIPGKVGRLLFYTMSDKEIKDEGGIDVPAANASGDLSINARIVNEAEVNFPGGIKGKYAVGQEDVEWKGRNQTELKAADEVTLVKWAKKEAADQQKAMEDKAIELAKKQFPKYKKNVQKKSETDSHSGDFYENQADRVADQVVSGQGRTTPIAAVNVGAMQSKAVQRLRETSNPQPELDASRSAAVQAKSNGAGGTTSSSFDTQLASSKGGGHSMDDNTRSEMESGIGADFSGVRIHTGSNAVQMSSSIGAQAFTHGNDIYFNSGKYDPGSTSGKHLLAHELTHTVQQGASPASEAKSNASASQVQPSIQRKVSAEEMEEMKKDLAASEAEEKKAVDPVPAAKAEKAAEAAKPKDKSKEKEKAPAEPKSKQGEAKPKAKKPKPKGGGKASAAPKPKTKGLGPVGKQMEEESAQVCPDAEAATGKLAENEKTHDKASDKLKQTEEAVVPPSEEGQSRANADQVDGQAATVAPQVDEKEAKGKLDAEISRSMPSNVKAMNEFKSKGKAKVIGNKVMKVVNKDVDKVKNTYNKLDNKSPPKPDTHTPKALPETEVAPQTPKLDLGKDAVPTVKEEQVDTKEFEKESDEIMKKEGITDDQLGMVDKGPLKEAADKRGKLSKAAKEEPAKIKAEAAKRRNKVDADMAAAEKAERAQLEKKRQKKLAETKKDQGKTKTALEKKREKVTQDINKIYEKAKTSVSQKLKVLETANLIAFNMGQKGYSQTFENEVNRDVNAWKRKRYSGFWGPAKWLKDKFVGIDGFPAVKNAFTRARKRYVANIDGLIKKITKANQKVIKDCKAEIAAAKKQIKLYVSKLGPELKDAGKKAQADMAKKLDELDKFVDQKAKELTEKLCKKKADAIKAIDKKIEKMKEAMGGLLSMLGNLLLEALLTFFKWALGALGIDTKKIMEILDKGKKIIKAIVSDPIGFIKNLFNAVVKGIEQFVANIKKHLINGLVKWLTGAMGDIDIQLPAKWDLKGILSLVLQVLGLTWKNIRAKLVKKVGEKKVKAMETGVEVIKLLINGGPMALWKWLKEKASDIKTQVMNGIRDMIIQSVVEAATKKLMTMLAGPWGAILQAIMTIWNLIKFLIDNFKRIMAMVGAVFDAIGPIAMGNIGPAANKVENAMAMTIPIILDFLAKLLGISGIGEKVKNVIKKVREPIDRIVDKALDWIIDKGKALWAKGKKAVKGLTDKGKKLVQKGVDGVKGMLKKVKSWFSKKEPFKSEKTGVKHHLYFEKKGDKQMLKMASPHPAFIPIWIERREAASPLNAAESSAKAAAEPILAAMEINANAIAAAELKLHKASLPGATPLSAADVTNLRSIITTAQGAITSAYPGLKLHLNNMGIDVMAKNAGTNNDPPTGKFNTGTGVIEIICDLNYREGGNPKTGPHQLDHSMKRHHFDHIHEGPGGKDKNSIVHSSLAVSSLVTDGKDLGVKLQGYMNTFLAANASTPNVKATETFSGNPYSINGRTYKLDRSSIGRPEPNHFFVDSGSSVWSSVSKDDFNAARAFADLIKALSAADVKKGFLTADIPGVTNHEKMNLFIGSLATASSSIWSNLFTISGVSSSGTIGQGITFFRKSPSDKDEHRFQTVLNMVQNQDYDNNDDTGLTNARFEDIRKAMTGKLFRDARSLAKAGKTASEIKNSLKSHRVAGILTTDQRVIDTIEAMIAGGFIKPAPKLKGQTTSSSMLEQQADRAADKVTSGRGGSQVLGGITRVSTAGVQSKVGAAKSSGYNGLDLDADIQSTKGLGKAMDRGTRSAMESGFGADFSGVRIHNDSRAHKMSSSIGARAFTHGNNIYFNSGEYNPQSKAGQHLLAHELTHTVQQGASKAKTPISKTNKPVAQRGLGSWLRSAGRSFVKGVKYVGGKIVDGAKWVGGKIMQGAAWVKDKILGWIKPYVHDIPGYTLLTVIAGRDPVGGGKVARTPENILHGVMGMMVGGNRLFKKMNEHGAITKGSQWLMKRINALGFSWSYLGSLFERAWDGMSIRKGVAGNLKVLKNVFGEPLRKIARLIIDVGAKFLQFLKDAVLIPMARLAHGKRGYTMLTVIIGEDPITGKKVKRNAANFIGGFMQLVGMEERYKQLREAKIMERAWAWFSQRVAQLDITWDRVVGLFGKWWNSLAWYDIVLPPLMIIKAFKVFGPFIWDIIKFAGSAAIKVLEFIFEGFMILAGPFGKKILGVLKRSKKVFGMIWNDPLGFAGNLIDAISKGIKQFVDNILIHLRDSLLDWLFGAVADQIRMPENFDLMGILDLGLQILGLTYQNFRRKLVDRIGEKAVEKLERAYEFIKVLVTEGLQAAWEKILEFGTEIISGIISGVTQMVIEKIVKIGAEKLASMVAGPFGAVIQAVITIYNAIKTFIERINQILDFVTTVLDAVEPIALGKIDQAANWVEKGMQKAMTLMISFLAGLIGLGDVPDKVKQVIEKIRAPIDKALNTMMDWVINGAKSLLGMKEDGSPEEEGAETPIKMNVPFKDGDGEDHNLYFKETSDDVYVLTMASDNPRPLRVRLHEKLAEEGISGDEQKHCNDALKGLDDVDSYVTKYVDIIEDPEHDQNAAKLGDITTKVIKIKDDVVKGGVDLEEGYPAMPDVSYGGLHRGAFGSSARASVITPEVQYGSGPQVDREVYDDLNLRRHSKTSAASYYVKGHLLNDNLGGPGTTWSNLTPLSRQGNKNHSDKVEETVKDTVFKEGKVVKYVVSANYDSGRSQSLLSDSKLATDPYAESKRKVIEAESMVPTSLSIVAQVLDKHTLQPVENIAVPNAVDNPVANSSIDDYAVSGQPVKQTVDLANDTGESWKLLYGVGDARKADLDAYAPYTSKQEVKRKLNDAGITWIDGVIDQWQVAADGGAHMIKRYRKSS